VTQVLVAPRGLARPKGLFLGILVGGGVTFKILVQEGLKNKKNPMIALGVQDTHNAFLTQRITEPYIVR
jgi:hypothetical protein